VVTVVGFGDVSVLDDDDPGRALERVPCQQFEVALDGGVAAPGDARRSLGHWLRGAGCPAHVVDDVTLLASELVTNGVVHAKSALHLVSRIGDGRLRVEVHDKSGQPPAQRAPDTTHGGYGLQLVAALADSWGWVRTRGGKYVWAEVTITPGTP
jgi:anti-sigma regulatory factor (Ser/Thr protein kinase)